ncbi:MAG: hypothetical protein DRJ52_02305, partial [Thermoprotei archaeon]
MRQPKSREKFRPSKEYYFFLLGLSLVYTSTLLTLYNALHVDLSSFFSYIFLFVHIIWFLIVINIAVNMMRLYKFKRIKCKKLSSDNLPTVSLVTVAYDEPKTVSDLFVKAVSNIDYPRDKLKVFIVEDLKDGKPNNKKSFEWLKKRGFNVTYIARSNRDGYRGGALNTALKRIDTKYVIVLDIDHLPEPNMVKRLVGYAEANPEYDVIMFPQKFRNYDENAITFASNMGYELDYGIMRKGCSVVNSAFCVGSNWIGRTKSIKEAGGFDDTTIVEDLATSLKKWHPRGLKITMVEDILAYGLVPDELEALRKQQHRWAKGSFDLFKDYYKMFGKLSWPQRFSYLFSIMWYLVGLASIASQLFPLATLLGFNFLIVTDIIEYIVIVVNLTFLQVLIFTFPLSLMGYTTSSAFRDQAVGLLVAESYSKAFFSSLIGKKVTFEVTRKLAKGEKFHKL